jgi:hypothetical protein
MPSCQATRFFPANRIPLQGLEPTATMRLLARLLPRLSNSAIAMSYAATIYLREVDAQSPRSGTVIRSPILDRIETGSRRDRFA